MKKYTAVIVLAAFMLVLSSFSAYAQYAISPSGMSIETAQESSATQTFTIRNSGLSTMTNVIFAYNPNVFSNNGKQITLTFEPSSIATLGIGETRSVVVSANIPAEILTSESSRQFNGEIVISNAQAQTSSVALNIVVQNILRIKEIEVNSEGKDEELVPGEEFTVKIEVENTHNDVDLEDCDIEVRIMDGSSVLEDEDGDSIQEDTEISDLDSDDSETVELTFKTPYDVSDEDEYTVEASIICDEKDTGNSVRAVDTSLEVSIKKEKHKIEIYRTTLEQSSLACYRTTSLNIGVRNVGEESEDVEMTVKNAALDMSRKAVFELDEDSNDDDFDHTEIVPIDVSGAAPGVYTFTITAIYDDGDERESASVNLEVKDCPTDIDTGSNPGSDNTGSNGGSDNTDRPEVEVVKVPMPPVGGVQAVDPNQARYDDSLVTGLIVATIGIIAIGFLVVVIKILSTPKRRY